MPPKKTGSFVRVEKVSATAATSSQQQQQKAKQDSAAVSRQKQKVAKKSTSGAPASSSTSQTTASAASATKKAAAATKAPALVSGAAAAGEADARDRKKAKNLVSRAIAASRKKKSAYWKKVKPYIALQLRNLPTSFQEPQLRKFLIQFGVPIRAMYVVRNKKRRASRGVAYVAFNKSSPEHAELLESIRDECDAMNLGGNTVEAKWVRLRRRMPSREAADSTRDQDFTNRTAGVSMNSHDVTHFDWVRKLENASASEKKANKFLQTVGIPYKFNGFSDQVKLLTPELRKASAATSESVARIRLVKQTARHVGFGNTKVLAQALVDRRTRKTEKRRRRRQAKKAKKVAAASTSDSTTTSATGAAAARGASKK